MKKIPLTRGEVALVDDRDFPVVSRLKWRLHTNQLGDVKYAVSGSREATVYMHRLLASDSRRCLVDHRNGNGLDNRRRNLRKTDPSGNQRAAARRRRGEKPTLALRVGRLFGTVRDLAVKALGTWTKGDAVSTLDQIEIAMTALKSARSALRNSIDREGCR